ncbi:hypothetical protein PHSY_006628 [Pseudozyma hubeiensis SY62]|uniref:Uncharacterized protein n=1 Tax=Pseudozyma hubeiensis (strain SY62) TaxID=1305764 RepID=R9PCD2_PSEHS|nr:hypothetical protein PHSY_006628 [Pseudozyma hubeiensis SY62]GAC99031.1 hypothetical protein PHSY_006628 [Pseudozyma hubeiensis SY62]
MTANGRADFRRPVFAHLDSLHCSRRCLAVIVFACIAFRRSTPCHEEAIYSRCNSRCEQERDISTFMRNLRVPRSDTGGCLLMSLVSCTDPTGDSEQTVHPPLRLTQRFGT